MTRSSETPIRLANAEAAQRASPRTYAIPRRIVRDSLRPGDLVKLPFVIDPPIGTYDTERMWVQVIEAAGGRYRGRLDNEPRYLHHLHPGDWIEFGPEHVIGREAVPGDPLYLDPALFVVVSRLVWDSDEWPTQLERRPIPDPTFSGWFVLAGTETPEYLADPNNFVPVPAASLFNRFRVLESGLEGPIGTRMSWHEVAVEYRPTP
jgi:hypothetical protein